MLKIDLLPRQFGIARTNKKWLGIFAVLLAGVAVGFFLWLTNINTTMGHVQAELDEVTPIADEVRDLRSDIQSKESDLQPIKDKLQFIAQADRTGSVFWDRFHEINKYIWGQAQVLNFSITPGGGVGGFRGGYGGYGGGYAPSTTSVQFTVILRGTQGAGRFLLNLLRCPALTNITMSGLPAGKAVAVEEAVGFGMPGMGLPGMPGMRPPGVRGMGPPGMPGMGPPGIPGRPPGMPGLGMAPGRSPVGLARGGWGVEVAEPGSPEEEIILQVTASLTEPITIPQPAAPAMAGAGFGMPGMGPPGMPGMGGPLRAAPGMGAPGGPPTEAPEGAKRGPQSKRGGMEELEAEET